MILNKEQVAYIESLKQTHPGLEDSILESELISAEWTKEEIAEALLIYKEEQIAQSATVVSVTSFGQSVEEMDSESEVLDIDNKDGKVSGESVAVEGKTKTLVIMGVVFVLMVAIVVTIILFPKQQNKEDLSGNLDVVDEQRLGDVAEEVENDMESVEIQITNPQSQSDIKPIDAEQLLLTEKVNLFERSDIRNEEEKCMTVEEGFMGNSLRESFDQDLSSQEICLLESVAEYHQSYSSGEYPGYVRVSVIKITKGSEAYLSSLFSMTELLIKYKNYELFSSDDHTFMWISKHGGEYYSIRIFIYPYRNPEDGKQVLDFFLENNQPIVFEYEERRV